MHDILGESFDKFDAFCRVRQNSSEPFFTANSFTIYYSDRFREMTDGRFRKYIY